MSDQPKDRATEPAVVVAGDDLLFSTQIASRLHALGYRAVVAHTPSAFHDALGAVPAAAVINLASRRFDAIAAIRRAKQDAATRRIRLLGFCGHADTARQEAARTAGCDIVATNGEVIGSLPRLLRTLLTPPTPPAVR